MKHIPGLGPGLLVTAAFIGPGTVLTASTAGAEFGTSLLWAVLFAVVAAIVLQEMAARLGIVTGQGLAAAIRLQCQHKAIRTVAIVLVLGAILFGNTAYQTGNIVGAARGLEMLLGFGSAIWSIIIAAAAIAVIMIGRFSVLQVVLSVLVAVMGMVFLIAAIASGPDLAKLAAGLKPGLPKGSEWFVIGLIGTTVVPYNLFLHASGAAERYADSVDHHAAIRHSRIDTIVAIVVGGFITAALLITASVAFADTKFDGIPSIARQLEPVLGNWAPATIGIGLFAAGLTSSITAPVAAAYAAAGCFGWNASLSDPKIKATGIAVVLLGLAVALSLGTSPQQTIVAAQIANGLLLPIVAGFLLWVLNRNELMSQFANGWVANGLGLLVLAITMAISASQFRSVFEKLFG